MTVPTPNPLIPPNTNLSLVWQQVRESFIAFGDQLVPLLALLATPTAPVAPPAIVPIPPITPTSAPVTKGLARIQHWLGRRDSTGQLQTNTLGVYLGIYTAPWRANDFEQQIILPFVQEGIDYACVKFGEYGTLWYDGTITAIRDVFRQHGLGMAPYYFCRPETVQQDLAICIQLAQACDGVILDCEEQFINQGTALRTLVEGLRAACPDTCIIVSGYGDPITAFGKGWPFEAIAQADGYQPQWYLGYWDPYKQHGWQYAINWADQECATAFQAAGLGQDFAIQPAINVQGVDTAHLAPLGQFLMNWHASLCLWEAHDLSLPAIQAIRSGIGRG